MIEFLCTIWDEMMKGNFSFAILIVGIIQCILAVVGIHYAKKAAKKGTLRWNKWK